jgi:sterol desaturase/sphingolipid hydroxylase (fatty acid hydroxylase superfamily)
MEGFIRFGAFVGLLAVMAMWEVWRPRRPLSQGKARHWSTNLTLTVLNTLVVRLTVGAVAVSAALFAQQRGWGVWSLLHLPTWANIVLSLVVLDFAIYLQHVLSHALPVFWRLHRVHHTDLDVDVTTSLRFHPLEILLSLIYKAALVLLLGAHPAAVIAFEVILNAASEFNHANVRLPAALEPILRKVVITPDLHRIHHSVIVAETNSNFGFSVPFWDRLCGTYQDQPSQPQTTMPLGLQDCRDARALGLGRLLCLPFVVHRSPTHPQQTTMVAGEAPEGRVAQGRQR